MTTLSCPKCGSDMRSYERNRVLVDQCTGCGGLFLDRGELEKLVAAENEWHAGPAAPVPAAASAPTPQDRGYDQRRHEDRGDTRVYEQRGYDRPYDQPNDRRDGYQQPYRKKKKSFLSELFDD